MPNPNEDNPIQKLWEYIPPYTTPNYPPQVEVITTTNTGDTQMTEEPDIVERLRNYNTCSDTDVDEAADEIERLRKERDKARLQTARILNEIDCRIEHGAESNGHLEAIHNLFKENTNV